VKIASGEGYITDADVIEGIEYAVREGARVVNGSFGGGPENVPMQATAAMSSLKVPTEAAAIDGTSMAAPYVTGAVALYWSANPAASVADVRRRILASVDKVASLTGKVQTGGRLNLAKLMGAAR
jgi:subtilisin family serine protease